MDRKVKRLLKGAGLQRLVGGLTLAEMNLKREEDAARLERNKAFQKTKSEADAKAKADADADKKTSFGDLRYYADGKHTRPDGYVEGPPSAPAATVDDFAYYMEHGNPSTIKFEKSMYEKARDVLLDRHINDTPDAFETSKARQLANLRTPFLPGYNNKVKKNGTLLLRDQWLARELEKVTFGKKAEQYIATEDIYRQPPMDRGAWEQDVQRNIANWRQRVEDAIDPEVKASLIAEFGTYQQQNASYEQYLATNESKPPPPSFEGKDLTEITKQVGERTTRKDKEEKLKSLRNIDDFTSHDVAEKIKNLNGMKTGNPIADEEIDKALAYIKWGEDLREQIAKLEREATEKDMTLADYYESVGSPELVDVEGKVAEENKKIDDAIERYKHSGAYVWDQFKKWGMLVIDIGSNFLPYILPFPIGNVIQLGYQAFAPPGSIYRTEGSFTQKLQSGLLNGAEQAVLGAIGLGRKRRKNRKYMAELMEGEGGGASESARSSEPCSRSRSSPHAKSRSRTQK